jgi:hypothetical protein
MASSSASFRSSSAGILGGASTRTSAQLPVSVPIAPEPLANPPPTRRPRRAECPYRLRRLGASRKVVSPHRSEHLSGDGEVRPFRDEQWGQAPGAELGPQARFEPLGRVGEFGQTRSHSGQRDGR